MTPTTNQEPPISDPVVMIGGRTMTVIYDYYASYKCSEWELNTDEVMKVLWNMKDVVDSQGQPVKNDDGTPKKELVPSGKWQFCVTNLFAACVAHNFREAGEIAPNGEQWAIRLAKESVGTFGIISKALYEAMGKHFRERMQGLPQPVVIREASSSGVN